MNPGRHAETEGALRAPTVSHPSVLADQGALDEQRRRDALEPMYSEVGFHPRQDWKIAPAVFDEHTLRILGHPVMEDWEWPYMKKLAEIAKRAAGERLTILEVGFGLGLSAGYIISEDDRVARHIIIEANRDVAERARTFASNWDGRVQILEGLWDEVIGQVPDESCDGILFDAYPLDESEVQNQVHFAGTAYKKLRAGGYFTYFSDEATGFRPEHLKTLVAAGFSEHDISHEIVSVSPPPDCQYWKSDTIMAPIIFKRS